jgi:pimeloyl-ACP methyl ester carboxylesterase
MAEFLTYCAHEGLAPGSQGWWDDAYAHIRPWGFQLSDITVPVLVLHGRQDKFVPFGHGQWLATHIPGVEARLLDNDGHLTLVEHRVSEVHAWLSERL